MNVACDYGSPMQMLTTEKNIAARPGIDPGTLSTRGERPNH